MEVTTRGKCQMEEKGGVDYLDEEDTSSQYCLNEKQKDEINEIRNQQKLLFQQKQMVNNGPVNENPDSACKAQKSDDHEVQEKEIESSRIDEVIDWVQKHPDFQHTNEVQFSELQYSTRSFTEDEEHKHLLDLCFKWPHVFLERYGSFLERKHLTYFAMSYPDRQEVQFYLHPRGSDAPTFSRKICRNRRMKKMEQLDKAGLFSEENLKTIHPALHYEIIGKWIKKESVSQCSTDRISAEVNSCKLNSIKFCGDEDKQVSESREQHLSNKAKRNMSENISDGEKHSDIFSDNSLLVEDVKNNGEWNCLSSSPHSIKIKDKIHNDVGANCKNKEFEARLNGYEKLSEILAKNYDKEEQRKLGDVDRNQWKKDDKRFYDIIIKGREKMRRNMNELGKNYSQIGGESVNDSVNKETVKKHEDEKLEDICDDKCAMDSLGDRNLEDILETEYLNYDSECNDYSMNELVNVGSTMQICF